MSDKRRQFWLELLRIVLVILIALGLGFIITLLVSEEPVQAFTELLTGPFPRLSMEDGGLSIRGLNR